MERAFEQRGGVQAVQPVGGEQKGSLFEQIGGPKAMEAAVELFYRRVLMDERISPFFEGVDMERQAAKQQAFLTMVCGGPHNYTGMDMRKGHAHLVKRGLNDAHFDAVAEHLGGTLEELGVARLLIEQVLKAAESMRADVLNR
ncbi:group I truncated hemoglobin [Hyalangium minutum]|uniref:Group 1 truncated hemoglobin n=1 Tax=Hyalangium minutum TaxID=394096 RepID=A0A085W3R4_9BACT|nr:group 1 truncated hemoglobin [Hyalangium minutum]KFE62327.1 Cyanoglobin [Hyalangium minutum]